jgi:hypothetical protein
MNNNATLILFFKKNFLNIIFIVLFIIASIVFLTKIQKYLILKKFSKVIFISFFKIVFFLGIFIKKKKFYIFSIFILVFFIYALNLGIGIIDYNLNNLEKREDLSLKKMNLSNDKRNVHEFINDKKKEGKKIYPYVTPSEIMKKVSLENHTFISGISNKIYAQCKEAGKWKVIVTDKYGFNNNFVSNKNDIIIAGDSFAEGICVDENKELTSLLKKNGLKSYTVGFSGNGPLLSLASLIEINKEIHFNTIVWLIFRNDFYDLEWESKDLRLTKYLNEDFKGNNIISNKKKSDQLQINFIELNTGNRKQGFNFTESVLELKYFHELINKILVPYFNNQNNEKREKIVILNKIFNKLNNNFENKNKIIIYLPDYFCFTSADKECGNEYSLLKESIVNFNNIKIYNFQDYVKNNNIDYLKIFNLGLPYKHYSEIGYQELSNLIIKIYKNNYIENK